MANESPKVVVLAGPNGAGKSTSAAKLLLGALKVHEFVNADTIAQGLSAFAQERVAFDAGRIMLTRLRELAAARASFAFETTLASRSYASWLADCEPPVTRSTWCFSGSRAPTKRSRALPSEFASVAKTCPKEPSAAGTTVA